MKYFIGFCRLFVGSLFIVSGLIKANDPLGFSYKLEEYFAESALGLPFLEPWAIYLAIAACLSEIILGFALLFGAKIKLATWSLLILTLFFGWLTAYTATCDPNATFTILVNGQEITQSVTCVTDCGCFGDAMKESIGRSLTPWESFGKDMILLVFLLPIFFMQKKIKLNTLEEDKFYAPLALIFVLVFSWVFTWYSPVILTILGFAGYFSIKKIISIKKSEWLIAGFIALIAFGFTIWCYSHLPIRDYRPYAVGKDIVDGMKSAEEKGLEPPKFGYNYMLLNKSSQEKKVMTDKEYIDGEWWEKEEWEMLADETEQVKLKDGYEPPIHDFFISDSDGNDRTPELLSADKIVLMIAYDIRKTDDDAMIEVNRLAEQIQNSGIPFVALTSAVYKDVEAFKHKHQTLFDFWSADAIMLKTTIRSNPGIIVLKKGVVVGKYHCNDIPAFEVIEGL